VIEVRVADPVRVKNGGSLSVDDFADIAAGCESVEFDDGALVVTFAGDLTPEQQLRVRIRCASLNDDAEALLTAAAQAYTANLDYLALDPPTTSQALAQVGALTRQVNGLLRFVTRL
jgi:hypothetical protein